MRLSPDEHIFRQDGFVKLTGTLVFTWVLMGVLVVGSKLITRRLATGIERTRGQNLLEIIVTSILAAIEDVGLERPARYLSFLGTLFLFVAAANLFTVVPGFEPPTASLSTTVALALSVFVAVPVFGIAEQGLGGYLKSYTEPTLIMLPFNIISELSRTLALAVRLFGNMMSGGMILAILLAITPFIFPVVMTALGRAGPGGDPLGTKDPPAWDRCVGPQHEGRARGLPAGPRPESWCEPSGSTLSKSRQLPRIPPVGAAHSDGPRHRYTSPH